MQKKKKCHLQNHRTEDEKQFGLRFSRVGVYPPIIITCANTNPEKRASLRDRGWSTDNNGACSCRSVLYYAARFLRDKSAVLFEQSAVTSPSYNLCSTGQVIIIIIRIPLTGFRDLRSRSYILCAGDVSESRFDALADVLYYYAREGRR